MNVAKSKVKRPVNVAKSKVKRPVNVAKSKVKRPVIVCTEYRGVFFGYSDDTSGDVIKFTGAKMAIHWATTRGVMELANIGPNPKSKISLPADIEVRKVTSVFEVTPAAEAAWQNA